MKAKFILLTFGILTISTQLSASEVKKTVASFNMTPCSRTKTYKDSFGITWPTLEFADQSVDVNVVVSSDNISYDDIDDAINTCNQVALGVAAGVGIYSISPGAFASAYEGSFHYCLATRLASELSGVSVHFDSSCHW